MRYLCLQRWNTTCQGYGERGPPRGESCFSSLVSTCVHLCVRLSMCVCVRARVCVYVCVHVCVCMLILPHSSRQWLERCCSQVAELGVFGSARPNHVLVNEYTAGQGIMVKNVLLAVGEPLPYHPPLLTTATSGWTTV